MAVEKNLIGINRIRLEFKVASRNFTSDPEAPVLIESDWNLKSDERKSVCAIFGY